MRVLLVDDQPELLELVGRALERDGHAVECAESVQSAREKLSALSIDALVLDLGLPDGSGEALCRELRRRGNAVPILVLTAKGAVASRVECFDAGADDFLCKPFAIAELRARLRALGRRASAARVFRYEHAGVLVDFSARRAYRRGEEAPVTAREWAILETLASRSGRVVSRSELLDSVWGDDTEANSQSLDTLVARIRRKLDPALIRTVRGEGYAIGE